MKSNKTNLNEAPIPKIDPKIATDLANKLRGMFSTGSKYSPPAKITPKPPGAAPRLPGPADDIVDVGSTTSTGGQVFRDAGRTINRAGKGREAAQQAARDRIKAERDQRIVDQAARKAAIGTGVGAAARRAADISDVASEPGSTTGARAAELSKAAQKSGDFAKWLRRGGIASTVGLSALAVKELIDQYKLEKEITDAVQLKNLNIKDILKIDPNFQITTPSSSTTNVADKVKSSSPTTVADKVKPDADIVNEPETQTQTRVQRTSPPPPITTTTTTDFDEPETQTKPSPRRITPPPIPPVAIGTLPQEPSDGPPRRIFPPIMPPPDLPPTPPPPPPPEDEKPEPPKAEPPKREPARTETPPPIPPKIEPPKVEPEKREPAKVEPVKPQDTKPDDEDISWRAIGGTKEKIPGFEKHEEPYGYVTSSDGTPVVPGFKKDGSPRHPDLYNTPESIQYTHTALTEWLKLAGLKGTQQTTIKENKMKPYTPDTNDISRLLNLLKVYESEDKSANWQFNQENDPAWRAEAQRQRDQFLGPTSAERAANERSQAVSQAQFKADISTVKQPSGQLDPTGQSAKEFNQAALRLGQAGVDLPGLVKNEPNSLELDVGPGFPEAGGEQSKVRALYGAGMNEDEMEEGNLFTGNLAKARAGGKKEADLDGDGKMEKVQEDQLEECGDMGPMSGDSYGSGEMPDQKSKIVVNANMTSDGEKTLNVTAEGDAAEQLSRLLKLSGLMNGERKMEVDEEYANKPKVKHQSLKQHFHAGDDLHKEKGSYRAAAGGDNPMNAMNESLEARLWKEFQQAKQK